MRRDAPALLSGRVSTSRWSERSSANGGHVIRCGQALGRASSAAVSHPRRIGHAIFRSLSADPEPQPPLSLEGLIEAADPASLLIVIERRMSVALRGSCSAEDILQECFLHAWRARDKFQWRGARSFRAWLLSIVDHRLHDAADRLRAHKRGGGRSTRPFSVLCSDESSSSLDSVLPAPSTTPSRLASYREQAEAMQAALKGMPDELAEIVRLRLFEQVELVEIARRLGLGVSAVRHRFRRGSELYAARLRKALGSELSQRSTDPATVATRDASP